MADLNNVTLTGRLVRDPELRTTGTGKNVVSFTIAVDKRVKPQNDEDATADFIRVTAWGQTADFVHDYGSRGRKVGVEGRLSQNKYTDKDGNARDSIEIVANNVTFLDKPRSGDEEEPAPSQSTSRTNGARTNGAASRTSRAAAQRSPAADPNEYDPFADE